MGGLENNFPFCEMNICEYFKYEMVAMDNLCIYSYKMIWFCNNEQTTMMRWCKYIWFTRQTQGEARWMLLCLIARKLKGMWLKFD